MWHTIPKVSTLFGATYTCFLPCISLWCLFCPSFIILALAHGTLLTKQPSHPQLRDADSNTWHTVPFPATLFGATYAGDAGISATLGGGSTHVQCGGYNPDDSNPTIPCFAISTKPDGQVVVKRAAPLPSRINNACVASDGEVVVVAGGDDGKGNLKE